MFAFACPFYLPEARGCEILFRVGNGSKGRRTCGAGQGGETGMFKRRSGPQDLFSSSHGHRQFAYLDNILDTKSVGARPRVDDLIRMRELRVDG